MEKILIEQIIEEFPFYKISILKETLISDDIWFRKSKSQNFLIDKNYIKKIYENLVEYKGYNFIEVGGGSGNLSIILSTLANKLIIIEIDKYFSDLLSQIFNNDFKLKSDEAKNLPKNYFNKFSSFLSHTDVNILNLDFLKLNLKEIIGDESYILFGNIPYNISTKILIKLAGDKNLFKKIFLTTQKEYFERLIGKDEKSFLTIFCLYHFDVKKIFDIPSSAFYPKPKVNSTFFSITPKKNYYEEEEEKKFIKFISRSFSSKRKKFLNNFSDNENIYNGLLEIFKILGINPDIRAEKLDLSDFMNIFNFMRQKNYL